MQLDIRIRMNEKLFLRDPQSSAVGRRIVAQGLVLINRLGFEAFTFKKLAEEISTTEATIYRYFENKHRLLVYLTNWYWSLLEYKVVFSINNLKDPKARLRTIIRLLVREPEREQASEFISEYEGYLLVKWESSKAYLARSVTKDNKDRLFKPYKDLCSRIASIMREYNSKYRFPNSLASTLLEMSHAQKFFMENLPSLTDAPRPDDRKLVAFLESFIFSVLDA